MPEFISSPPTMGRSIIDHDPRNRNYPARGQAYDHLMSCPCSCRHEMLASVVPTYSARARGCTGTYCGYCDRPIPERSNMQGVTMGYGIGGVVLIVIIVIVVLLIL
jgi:hypothetical protein